MCTRERVSFSCPWTCPSATGWMEERKGNVWKNVGYGWKGELIGARDTDPWTRLVLSLFWRTRSFLGIMCMYIYVYIKKEKTSLVTDGIRRAQLLIGWDRKTANDCGEEKTFRWIISKRNYLRLGCEYTISYLFSFFEQVYGVFGGGGKGKPSVFYES